MNHRRPSSALLALAVLAACGHEAANAPPGPPLPPLQLAPFLPRLKQLAQDQPPAPDDATQQQLRDLGDVALGLVEADARTAARAERALLEQPRADFVLAPALRHADPQVRQRAAWLCGRTGDALLAFPLLLGWKDEMDAETSLWLAAALHQCGNDAGLAVLAAAMANAATAERAGTLAIELLRDLDEPLDDAPTYAALRAALGTRTAAWNATGRGCRRGVAAPPPTTVTAILAGHLAATEGTALRPVDEARFVLVRSGVLALPLLQDALGASEPYLRTMALQVLAEIGEPARALGPAVLPLLGEPLTASYAARTLGEIGADLAIPHLRAGLDAVDSELRAAALGALGLLRDEPSRPRFAALRGDANVPLDVRVQAAFAELCLGDAPDAERFVAERERLGDYHAPTLLRLRERLQRLVAARSAVSAPPPK